MRTRKEMKKSGRKVVKTHYVLLVLLCVVSIFYCEEFGFAKVMAESTYEIASGDGTHQSVGYRPLKASSTAVHEQVLNDIAEGDLEAGEEKADQQMEAYEQGKEDDPVLGHTRGQLAPIVNFFSSGKFYLELGATLSSLTKSKSIGNGLLVLLVGLISIMIYVFVQNLYQAILRRMFLEARMYETVPIGHLLHFKLVRRWVRASLTLLLTNIFQFLWALTIIGGPIKFYSYKMVPYIVAENPAIRPRDAVTLSRRMMDGHKWECFVLDLSFIGWHTLGFLTLGLSEIFWTVPYSVATYSEYYTELRKLAKEKNISGADMLNDTYLFEKDEEMHLREVYSDIEEQKAYIDEHRVTLPKARAFIAKNFGLWVGSTEEKRAYDEVDNRRQQIREDRAVIKGRIYPQRLNPRWQDKQNRIVRNIHFLRTYTIWSVILIFFVFSVIGWAWEVSLHLITDGVFVNRGIMQGPWLPIYGSGITFILILLARWRSRPAVEIALIVILCGVLEFTTSWYMEATRGQRWWDYTGYFLNQDGRICAEGLFVFAVGGAIAIYLLIPVLDAMISHLRKGWLVPLCIILVVVFGADTIYSHFHPNMGEGITSYTDYKKPSTANGSR